MHEDGIPPDIEFMHDEDQNALVIQAGGAPEYTLKLSDSWFQHLIAMVVEAP